MAEHINGVPRMGGPRFAVVRVTIEDLSRELESPQVLALLEQGWRWCYAVAMEREPDRKPVLDIVMFRDEVPVLATKPGLSSREFAWGGLFFGLFLAALVALVLRFA